MIKDVILSVVDTPEHTMYEVVTYIYSQLPQNLVKYNEIYLFYCLRGILPFEVTNPCDPWLDMTHVMRILIAPPKCTECNKKHKH